MQTFPLSETIPFFLLDHSKIRRIRPLQEVQDIGQLRPFGMKRILPYIMIMETTTGEEFRRLGEFEGFEEFPDLYDLGKHPLWNLAD